MDVIIAGPFVVWKDRHLRQCAALAVLHLAERAGVLASFSVQVFRKIVLFMLIVIILVTCMPPNVKV